MDEMDDVAGELRVGAGARGLRVVDALFTREPDVLIDRSAASVDEVLDLAQSMFAPFVSIDLTHLDPAEVFEDGPDGASSPGVPRELVQLVRERAGQIDGVWMRWVSAGLVYLYSAAPPWRERVAALQEEWASIRTAGLLSEEQDTDIRITYLADRIEQDATYRAGSQQMRRALENKLIAEFRGPNDTAEIEHAAAHRANQQVLDNTYLAYAGMEGRMDELGQQLSQTDQWRSARRVPDRESAARDFLIELTGGYAPLSNAVVSRLRGAAERAVSDPSSP